MYTGSEAIIGRGTGFGIGQVSGTTLPTGITATTTSGSAGLTAVTSTTGVSIGMGVSGTGIPPGARVGSKGSGTLGLVDANGVAVNATATGSTIALTFSLGYTAIGECNDTSPSGRAWDTEEVTNFESAVDKEYIKGLRNPGKFTVKYNLLFGDAGQEALEAAFDDTVSYTFQLKFPAAEGFTTGEIWTFSALVLSVDPTEIVPGKALMGSCELQVTGPRTIIAAA